ncbi:MAG: TetR/AcrR family transcriptional regulator [Actinomycetes bacterium]
MTSPSFRPPRQARSVATLDRIVRAAQELLAERGFDQATVDDIVARAGSSKGSFYSRFADKEALLAYLGGECLARAKATWAEQFDPDRVAGTPLAEVIDEFVGRLLDEYREQGSVLRALVLEARLHPGNEFERMTDELDAHVRDTLATLLAARAEEIEHRDPAQAARVGLLMLDATLREAIMFSTGRGRPLAVPPRELRRELARAFLAYLGSAPARG